MRRLRWWDVWSTEYPEEGPHAVAYGRTFMARDAARAAIAKARGAR